jgi:putative spermidine/putrescine transport system permease protein
MKKKKSYAVMLLPFLILVIFYELIPLFQLLIGSFFNPQNGAITLDYYIRIFSTPLYQQALINSIRISLISSFVGMCVAFLGVIASYEKQSKVKKMLYLILNMTSNFSGIPLAFAFMILMGNTGVLTLLLKNSGIPLWNNFNLYSGTGLIVVYIYFQIPLATLLLMPSFLILKKEWKESAKLMGASNLMYWIKIGIPNLLPSLLGTFSVLIANSLAAYATAYALILNNYALLSLQISSKFKGDVRVDKQMGGALAMVLILLMFVAIITNNHFVKRKKAHLKF